MSKELEQQCLLAADRAVPEYRHGKRTYSCGGHVAKRWQAAWDAACWALGTDPATFRTIASAEKPR